MLENFLQMTADQQLDTETFMPLVYKTVTTETDPTGRDQHAPGAKVDAGKIRAGLVLGSFAYALRAVCEVGTFGARKYSDNGWRQVPAGIDRYTDAMLRHYLAHASGEDEDQDSGLSHLAHMAWNALAILELTLNHDPQKGLYDG